MPVTLDDIEKELDVAAEAVKEASTKAQKAIYEAVQKHIQQLDTKAGSFDRTQNPTSRLAKIEKSLQLILKTGYAPSVFDYLEQVYNTTGKVAIIHKRRNGIKVDQKLFDAAKVDLEQKMNQSMFPEGDTFRAAYVQPIKNLIYLKVRTGATIADLNKTLATWNKGELSTANNVVQQPVPSLDRYATQLARDTAFQHNGHVNQLIADEFELNAFEWSGGIIASSAPICIHLVQLDRPILFSEIDGIIAKYPKGVTKGTNHKNFATLRGHPGCRHQVFPIRVEENK